MHIASVWIRIIIRLTYIYVKTCYCEGVYYNECARYHTYLTKVYFYLTHHGNKDTD